MNNVLQTLFATRTKILEYLFCSTQKQTRQLTYLALYVCLLYVVYTIRPVNNSQHNNVWLCFPCYAAMKHTTRICVVCQQPRSSTTMPYNSKVRVAILRKTIKTLLIPTQQWRPLHTIGRPLWWRQHDKKSRSGALFEMPTTSASWSWFCAQLNVARLCAT